MDKKVTYDVGNPHFRGNTKIEVSQDDSVNITFTLGEEKMVHTNVLLKEESAKLWSAIDGVDLCSFSADRVAQPGEVKVKFTKESGEETCSSEVWINDRFSNEGLNLVMELFDQLNTRVLENSAKL